MSAASRSEEHTSELQSHSEISYAVFCLKKKKSASAGGSSSVSFGRPSAAAAASLSWLSFFFFNDTATTEIYTLSYHSFPTRRSSDLAPSNTPRSSSGPASRSWNRALPRRPREIGRATSELQSHSEISYAVFCLKKKKVRRGRATGRLHSVGDSPPSDLRRRCRRGVRCRRDGSRPGSGHPRRRFSFNDTAPTEIYTLPYTLSLHDALPIYSLIAAVVDFLRQAQNHKSRQYDQQVDRKSTRLNSSHIQKTRMPSCA